MTRNRRIRIGYFTYLEGERPQNEVYEEVVERFELAESLGFDSAWVAQHHFGHHGGLPSPFVFFASLAARTRRIELGTAIVALPLEHPIRVAEDAAVLDALHPGRLQLGVGTGFSSDQVLAMFGRPGGDRRQRYEDGLEQLMRAFEGLPITDDGDTLNPPAPALLHRIWESPSSMERVVETARRGNGLLLSRIAIGGESRPTPEIQVPLVERYLAELAPGVEPRLGFSRTVYPTRDPGSAYRNLSRGLERIVSQQASQGLPPDGFDVDGRFRHHNIHFGTPEQVIESLLQEPLIEIITDLICQVQPGLPTQEQTLEAIELIGSEVAPALGWQSASLEVAAR